MAGLLKRFFGKRDESSPDIDAMLDWSPGPPTPAPSFRVSPPPPPPPPPAPTSADLSTQVLWGAPPPPPPPPAPEPVVPVEPVGSHRNPRVRIMLADGTVLHPSVAPEWEGRISYLARNLFPPGQAPARPRPPKVRLVLADGTVIEEAGDELEQRMRYLAENLLPRKTLRA